MGNPESTIKTNVSHKELEKLQFDWKGAKGQAEPDLSKLDQFDKKNFIIGKELGQGTYGQVFLLTEKGTKINYAMKV